LTRGAAAPSADDLARLRGRHPGGQVLVSSGVAADIGNVRSGSGLCRFSDIGILDIAPGGALATDAERSTVLNRWRRALNRVRLLADLGVLALAVRSAYWAR
jgi:hypothetical protein